MEVISEELLHSMAEEAALSHYGVLGMKWGRRKERKSSGKSRSKSKGLSPETKAKIKKASIVLGSAAGAAAIAVGAVYLGKYVNGNTKLSDMGPPDPKIKKMSDIIFEEPISPIMQTRGKHKGHRFLFDGGLKDAFSEYERAGFKEDMDPGFFKRYGNKNEKVAAFFSDPDGRKDRAGRPIHHSVIVPEILSEGVDSMDDLMAKIWPLLKGRYDKFYDEL